MRTVVAVLLAAALGVSSAFLVACGDRNSLIPKGDAAALQNDLDEASALYDREECRAAEARIRAASARAERLPPEVDGDLQAKLSENLDVVLDRIETRCGRTQTNTTPTQTQTTATTPTETTTTQETTTQETTTTDEPEPPPTTDETIPTPEPEPGQSGGTPSGGGRGP